MAPIMLFNWLLIDPTFSPKVKCHIDLIHPFRFVLRYSLPEPTHGCECVQMSPFSDGDWSAHTKGCCRGSKGQPFLPTVCDKIRVRVFFVLSFVRSFPSFFVLSSLIYSASVPNAPLRAPVSILSPVGALCSSLFVARDCAREKARERNR